jgi:hypothetical protein
MKIDFWGWKLEFQSLTGSIHTILDFKVIIFWISFNPSQVQFTLELFAETLWCSFNPSQFQSLTGSIHTCKFQLPEVQFTRLNSNWEIESFNPSQVQFTQRNQITKLTFQNEKIDGFNPSQVQFTQIDRVIRLSSHYSNPSQVQFTMLQFWY